MFIEIEKENFQKLEMFLFGLSFPCECKIQIKIKDEDIIYDYSTYFFNNNYYIQTGV